MDVSRAFSAPFEDRGWLGKAALGGLWVLLGVTSPAVYGYALDYGRAVATGRESPLPDWSDMGGQWVRGFLFSIAMSILQIPAILLAFMGMMPVIRAMTASMLASSAQMQPGMAPPPVDFSSAVVPALLFGGLSLLWTILVSFLTFGVAVNYAVYGTFGSMFAFGGLLQRIRRTPGYGRAWGMSVLTLFAFGSLAGLAGGGAGMAVPFLGSLFGSAVGGFMMFVAYLICAHLFGQWAADAYGLTGSSEALGIDLQEAGAAPPAPPALSGNPV